MINNKQGFTVLEILITTIIVAILSIASIYAYQLYVEEARASEVIPIVRAIFAAQQDYYDEHGYWTTIDNLPVQIDGEQKISSVSDLIWKPFIYTKHFAYGTWMQYEGQGTSGQNNLRGLHIAVKRLGKELRLNLGTEKDYYIIEFKMLETYNDGKLKYTAGASRLDDEFGNIVKDSVRKKIIKKITGETVKQPFPYIK